MSDVDKWLELPEGETGQQIRHRKTFDGAEGRYRLGGAEPKAIVAESRNWVIYRVWSHDGRDLGEHICPKPEFERKFERRPEQ